jgi:hypothetical protein
VLVVKTFGRSLSHYLSNQSTDRQVYLNNNLIFFVQLI